MSTKSTINDVLPEMATRGALKERISCFTLTRKKNLISYFLHIVMLPFSCTRYKAPKL